MSDHGEVGLPPGFPTNKEELMERLENENFYRFIPNEDAPPEPFGNYREYFEISQNGALKFIPKLLADDIMRNYHFLTFSDTGEVYVYDKDQGIYKPNGENLIRTLVAINLDTEHRKNHGDEVLYHIKVSTFKNRHEIRLPDDILVLKNGLFNIATRKLHPFTPRIIAFNNIPVNYNPDADCPKIKKFFSEVVTDEDAEVLQEAFGYTLKNGYVYHKAFMCARAQGGGPPSSP